MTRPRIGVIGVGLLGTALAQRLLDNGYHVVGHDTDPTRRQALADLGGESAPVSSRALEHETVLLSLPTSEIVADVLRSAEAWLRPGTTIIDTTTGDPDQMSDLAGWLASKNIAYIEANVAGSSVLAREGKAVLFVAGPPTVVDRSRPILDTLGRLRFYLGEAGQASRFKLVHNLVLGLHRAVLAEGLAFSEALGFDAQLTLDILRQTPAASEVMATKGPKMATGDYSTQAKLSQHAKDVRLIMAEADRRGVRTALTALHHQLLTEAERLGLGDSDNSAVIEVYRQEDER